MSRERAPGQYSRQFRATTEIATGKQVKGDDGLPTRRWDTAADLMERVTYVGDLERHCAEDLRP